MNTDLHQQQCQACEGIGTALNAEQIKNLMPQIQNEWQVKNQRTELNRTFQFKNYYQTMAFVNALAWVAHQQNLRLAALCTQPFVFVPIALNFLRLCHYPVFLPRPL